MKSLWRPLVVLAIFLMAGAARSIAADSTAAPPANAQLQVFLLVGQSNMSGRGHLDKAGEPPHPRVWMLNKAGQWVPAADPLHFDKPKIVGVGPGLSFGQAVADANPDAQIGLVPCAFGGTSIEQWHPGDKLYNQAIARARIAMKHGHLAGILWHQGESDANANRLPTYPANLEQLIASFRHDLNSPDAPFIVGQLGRFHAEKAPFTVPFNEMLVKFASDHPNVACVSSEGLTSIGDFTHFDAASQRKFGQRYAAAYLKLIGQSASTQSSAAHR